MGRDRLVLWLPVAMGAGVLLYFALRVEPPGWAGAAVAGPAGLAALAVPGRGRRLRLPLALLAAAGIGFAAAQLATARAPPPEALPRRAVVVTGTVRLLELLPQQGRRVTLQDVRPGVAPPLRRRVRVRLRDTDTTPLAVGDRIAVRALIRPPSPPFYPGGWDLQRNAFFAGLAGYGFAIGPVRVLAHHPPAGFAGWLERQRETIAARFAAALPGAPGAIAATLFTGEQTAIPEADRAAFRDSGLAHLLAVAGLHIGIVMGLAFGAVRALLAAWEAAALRWPCKPIAALAALGAGGAYMLLTGMHVPITRSFAMACLVTVAVLTGRRAVSLHALALAATVLILLAPQEVPEVSFQMSFSAVLALIAGYEAMRPRLRALHGDGAWWRRAALHVAALGLTSLLAGGASAPFAAYHFGRVQLYFVAANMLAVPVAALWVMPAGLVALALLPVGAERLALVPMGWGIRAIVWIARTTAALPAAVVAVGPMPGAGLAVLALGLAWLGLQRGRWRLLGVAGIVAGLTSPLLSRPADVLVSGDGRMVAVRTTAGVFVARGRGSSRFALEQWEQYWAAGPARPIRPDMMVFAACARSAQRPCMPAGPGTDGAVAGATPPSVSVRSPAGSGKDGAAAVVACGARDCLLRPRPGGPAVLLTAAAPGPAEMPAGCVAAVIVAPAALGAASWLPAPRRAAAGPGATAPRSATPGPEVPPWDGAGPARRGGAAGPPCPVPPRIDLRSLRRDGTTALRIGPRGVTIETVRGDRGDRPWSAVPAPDWPTRRIGLPFATAGA